MTDDEIIRLADACGVGFSDSPINREGTGLIFLTDRRYVTWQILTFARLIESATIERCEIEILSRTKISSVLITDYDAGVLDALKAISALKEKP